MPPRMMPRAQQPVPARPVVNAPPPRQTGAREKPWYQEPSVIGTVVVLVLIGIAFIVLITTAL